MKATIVINKLIKLIAKYGTNVELAVHRPNSMFVSSFEIKDAIHESGWIEIMENKQKLNV